MTRTNTEQLSTKAHQGSTRSMTNPSQRVPVDLAAPGGRPLSFYVDDDEDFGLKLVHSGEVKSADKCIEKRKARINKAIDSLVPKILKSEAGKNPKPKASSSRSSES